MDIVIILVVVAVIAIAILIALCYYVYITYYQKKTKVYIHDDSIQDTDQDHEHIYPEENDLVFKNPAQILTKPNAGSMAYTTDRVNEEVVDIQTTMNGVHASSAPSVSAKDAFFISRVRMASQLSDTKATKEALEDFRNVASKDTSDDWLRSVGLQDIDVDSRCRQLYEYPGALAAMAGVLCKFVDMDDMITAQATALQTLRLLSANASIRKQWCHNGISTHVLNQLVSFLATTDATVGTSTASRQNSCEAVLLVLKNLSASKGNGRYLCSAELGLMLV
jgi:hypothetical protein